MADLSGKVYAVTGGASGIGMATARQIADHGGIACFADVNEAGLESAKAYFEASGKPFLASRVDVSKRAEVEAWIRDVVEKFGRLDGAANIAGVIGRDHGRVTIADTVDAHWDLIMSVNLKGCLNCLRSEINAVSDGGSIVNLASIHATTGMANHGAYAASKHGVLGLTRVAAKEVGARGVRVNAVNPGSIYTPMMQSFWDANSRPADAPFDDPSAIQRQGTADEVAAVIVFLLGPGSTFVSGAAYAVDGAWSGV
ncbi:hypothetical protein KC333_g5703 [Hortaea werneckii]|nr:hypothetical protein KC333_g5703 [Hortaea werneckii]KAI7313634.1 hypothetical protein KC326_g5441 [Hortaea werneckii]